MEWRNRESRPGSFSKQFGWGHKPGLRLLHQAINSIFAAGVEPVPRDEARSIIATQMSGDPLIPLNFFLYNQIIDDVSCVVADQLVIEALERDHDRSFDMLGMCALNFSRVGSWKGAKSYQSHPAPWARKFIVEEVWNGNCWDSSKMNADVIEAFLKENLIFDGERPRKYANNLAFLYKRSGLLEISSSENEDWWAGAVFLFLDRCMMDGEIGAEMSPEVLFSFIVEEDFWSLTAADPALASYAAPQIIEEYISLGGLSRLGPEAKPDTPRYAADRKALPSNQRKALAGGKKPRDLGLNSVQRVYIQAQKQARNMQYVQWVKRMYEDHCAICGRAFVVDNRGTTYSEAGHVKPVGKPFEGPDHFRNILAFCPNHHKAFDRGGVWIDPNEGVPIVRSATAERSFDGRPLELVAEHEFDHTYAEWHARYFGHL